MEMTSIMMITAIHVQLLLNDGIDFTTDFLCLLYPFYLYVLDFEQQPPAILFYNNVKMHSALAD